MSTFESREERGSKRLEQKVMGPYVRVYEKTKEPTVMYTSLDAIDLPANMEASKNRLDDSVASSHKSSVIDASSKSSVVGVSVMSSVIDKSLVTTVIDKVGVSAIEASPKSLLAGSQVAVIDVSSPKSSVIDAKSKDVMDANLAPTDVYPSVIKPPASVSRVTFDVATSSHKITLNRPIQSNTTRYRATLSNSSYTSFKSNPKSFAVNRSQPNLPFLNMNNSLQLHLKLHVMDPLDKIVAWIPGSILLQKHPIVPKPDASFSLFNLFTPASPAFDAHKKPSLYYPAYLLLTSSHLVFFRPKFRLAELKSAMYDEQTSYFDPSELIYLKYKIKLHDLARIDVGPRRQYLVFRTRESCSGANFDTDGLFSIMFQTRSRLLTTLIIDSITTQLHEMDTFRCVINQDNEWFVKTIQDTLLLRPGPKTLKVVHYDAVWPSCASDFPKTLTDSEYDYGITETITKVDFEFLKLYLFGAFIRYHKPVAEADCRGVEIQHMSLVASNEYLYIMEERLYAWPPALVPLELSPNPNINASLEPILGEHKVDQKGLVIDLISPLHNVLGVGRLNEVVRLERWRSWRIDDGLGVDAQDHCTDLRGLGRALQNGHLGYLGASTTKSSHQQGTTSGWFWWIRIVFGRSKASQPLEPMKPPTSVPRSDGHVDVYYWWDLCFSFKESADEFIDSVRLLTQPHDIVIVLGDD